MPTMLTCPNGHQWQISTDEAASDATGACPICGTLPEHLLRDHAQAGKNAPNGGEVPDSQAPTAYNSDSWQSLPQPNALPPLRIAGYEILEELGQGGMGVVYKARQLSHDRLVAVKVIRRDRLAHEEAVRRFRREAQAAARLTHPNIVLVFDSDLEGDLHYLVMEYVPGMTLQRLVERDGPLAVEDACDFIRQAALGLQHVHEQSLVHRDIKPSNLMVRSDPINRFTTNAKMLKILDMGVARLFQLSDDSPVESLSTLTQPGAVIGTADFIAPEQLEDPRAADCRADLYSLGCTFYYLLIGQVPFPGGSLIQKLDRQRWQTPVGVHQLRPDIPEAVSHIVRKLMAKKPDERYQTPADLADDLEQLARGVSISLAAPAPMREVRRFKGHDDAVWSVAFSPDGKTAVSGGKDCTIRLWDIEAGQEILRFPRRTNEVRSVAFSHDGRLVLSASGASLRLWNVRTGKEAAGFIGHTDTIRGVAFSPDGLRVISCGDDRTVRVWDIGTGREIVRFARHRGAISSIAISHNGKQVLSGGRDQRLRLWAIRNGQEKLAFKAPSGQVLCVALAAGGHYALSGHFDTILRLWDLTGGRELRRLQGHKQMVTCAAFTADSRFMLSGSKDHTLRLWETSSGAELGCITAHDGGVTSVSVSPVAPLALSAGMDGELCLWGLPE